MDEELKVKIRQALLTQDVDALVAVDVDSVTYLSGCVLPFVDSYPDRNMVLIQTKKDKAVIICPFDWAEAIRDQGWEGDLEIYDENASPPPEAAVKTFVTALTRLRLTSGKLSLDVSRVPQRFLELLRTSLPGVDWVFMDTLIRELRMIKTKAEIKLLETAALQSDKGLLGALQHLEGAVEFPGYTLSEFSERVRVHTIEYGGSGIGHLATLQGKDAIQPYVLEHGIFHMNNLVRMEVTTHHLGYWSNASRMAVIGSPSAEQTKAYQDNLSLKSAAIQALRPGIPCEQVFEEVLNSATKANLRFRQEAGVGHGVGIGHREAPYLHPGDITPLQPGMVIALDIQSYGPLGELIRSKDTYEIVEDGSRLLSWHKDWNRLYAVTGFRAAH